MCFFPFTLSIPRDGRDHQADSSISVFLVHLPSPVETRRMHCKLDLSASHHLLEQPHCFHTASRAPNTTESTSVLVPSSLSKLSLGAVFQWQGGI